MSVRGQPQSLQVDWRTTVNPDGAIVAATDVDRAGGGVFAVSDAGRITASELADGTERWVSAVSGQPSRTSPLDFNPVTGELAIALDSGGAVLLDPATGDTVGSLPSDVRSVTHDDGDGTWYTAHYPNTDQVQLAAYDGDTRSLKWIATNDSTRGGRKGAVASSEEAGAVMITNGKDAIAHNPDGTDRWLSAPLSDEDRDYGNFAAAGGSRLFFGSRGSVAVLDEATGGRLGKNRIGDRPVGLATFPQAEEVYVAGRDGAIVGVDRDGATLWTENSGTQLRSIAVVVSSKGTVGPVVGDDSGRVTRYTTDHNPPPGSGDGGGGGGGGDGPIGAIGGPGTLAVLLAGVTTGSGSVIIEQQANLEQRYFSEP